MRRSVLALSLAGVIAAGGATAAQGGSVAISTNAYGQRSNAAAIAAKLAQAPAGYTGGAVTAFDGETVNVYVQNELLAADPSTGQKWADVLAGLVHGPEISTLSLYVSTLDRVTQTCGSGALGCYGNNRIVAIGQDVPGLTARAVITHEYGHHVAASRDDAPWQAVDWGTKRWSSYLNVCTRAAARQLAPGDEQSRYQFNPGEAFAEDYRVLNERRQGLTESPWVVVDQSLYPDQASLDALALDVTTPWAGPTATTFRSSLTGGATGRGFVVTTPLDGTFRLTLTSPKNSRFTARIVDPATGSQIAASTGPERVKSLETSVCGQRTLQVQVKRIRGAGAFNLAVSKP